MTVRFGVKPTEFLISLVIKELVFDDRATSIRPFASSFQRLHAIRELILSEFYCYNRAADSIAKF